MVSLVAIGGEATAVPVPPATTSTEVADGAATASIIPDPPPPCSVEDTPPNCLELHPEVTFTVEPTTVTMPDLYPECRGYGDPTDQLCQQLTLTLEANLPVCSDVSFGVDCIARVDWGTVLPGRSVWRWGGGGSSGITLRSWPEVWPERECDPGPGTCDRFFLYGLEPRTGWLIIQNPTAQAKIYNAAGTDYTLEYYRPEAAVYVDPGGNEAPEASFTTTQDPSVPGRYSFENTSTDPDDDLLLASWTFGDGGTGTGDNPSHTYTVSAARTVTLTVTDPSGAQDTATTFIDVDIPEPAPFTFEMPPQFGLDDDEDGRIDYPSTPEEVTPPDGFDVDLIIDREQCDDDTFTFVVSETAGERVLDTDRDGCTFATKLDEGTHDIALLDDGSEVGSRDVEIDNLLIVSIGDSYSSGEGNPEADPGLWRENKTLCHRSAAAGPALAALKAEEASDQTSVTFVHLACSGATITEGLLGPQPFKTDITGFDQLAEFDRLIEREVDALALSVGANDVGFGPVLSFCASHGDVEEEDGCDTYYYDYVGVVEAATNLMFPGNTSPSPLLTGICDGTTAGDFALSIAINSSLLTRSTTEKLLLMRDGRDWDVTINPSRWDYDGADKSEKSEVAGQPSTEAGSCEQASSQPVSLPLKQSVSQTFPRIIGSPDTRDGGLLGLPQIQPLVPQVSVNPPNLDEWMDRRVEELPDRFADLALEINTRVDPENVFLAEYMNPLTDDNGVPCTKMLAPPTGEGVSQQEAIWAWEYILSPLNEALGSAAAAASWNYVGGLEAAFVGHGYCATGDRWVVDLPDSANVQADPFGAMHPNAQGHDAFGTKLFEAFDDEFDLTAAPSAPSNGRSVSTDLIASAEPGDTELETESTDRFEVGDEVLIAPRTDREERGVIEAFGSIVLEDPVGYPHGAGTQVVSLGPAEVDGAVYVPVTPCRIVDSRQAGGVFANREIRGYAVRGSGGAFAAQGGLAGGCGIPVGASAVEASVTAVSPLTGGFFRAWPGDESMPNATFMNMAPGNDITNTGTLALAATGGTDLKARNFGGATQYVIDIQGYFIDPDIEDGAVYVPVTPCRIVDSRQAGGVFANREIRGYAVRGSGAAFAAQGGLAGGCGIPVGASAVEASATAVSPSTGGFFRAWPGDESMPNATFMNMAAGQNITNTGSIALASTGATDLKVRNFGGATEYVIDVQGYFIDPDLEDGAVYRPVSPCRVVDTRQAGGVFANREIREYQVGGDGAAFAAQGGLAGGCGIPADASAVEASVTAVSPLTGGFFRSYPADESMPNATFMNMAPGQDITNTGAIAMAATGTTDLKARNFGGATQYVIDVQGYFTPQFPPSN